MLYLHIWGHYWQHNDKLRRKCYGIILKKGIRRWAFPLALACVRLLQRLTCKRDLLDALRRSALDLELRAKKNERVAREKTKPMVSIFNTLVQLLTSEFRLMTSNWRVFFAYDCWKKNVGATIPTLPCFSRRNESKNIFVDPERSKSELDLKHVTSRAIIDRWSSICISIDS